MEDGAVGAVANMECRFGDVVPRVRFIVANLEADSRAILEHAGDGRAVDQRGQAGSEADTAESTLVPLPRMRLGLPRSLQYRFVKTRDRLVTQARDYWLLPAESYLTRRLFDNRVRRMEVLSVAAG